MKHFQSITLLALALTFVACHNDIDTVPQTQGPESELELRYNWPLPDIIPLPTGFEAEGIAIGKGADVYVTSIAYSPAPVFAGAIWKGSILTGEGDILVPPSGVPSGGIKYDRRTEWLYVCKPYGAQVYDAETGELLYDYEFADPTTSLINDVVVTWRGAYFTDSFNARIFHLPLRFNGQPDGEVEEIPLPDYEYVFDPEFFGINMNGIAATFTGRYLIVNNMTTGTLYRIDTRNDYATTPIEIANQDDAYFQFGDGLLLDGRDLYVCQNFANKIAVIRLDLQLETGEFIEDIVDEAFREPATIADKGNNIYAVNAYFFDTFVQGIDPATQTMEIVRVDK